MREKRLLAMFLTMVRFISLYSQQPSVSQDSISLITSKQKADSVIMLRKISKDAIDKQVIYNAQGYIKNDLVNKRSIMVKSAYVKYGDIEIKADSIVFNMFNNTVYAVGLIDSTGKVIGKPYFKSGSQEFESDTLKYNFKTKNAYIKNIVTKQDEGLLHSTVTKLLEDGTSNVYKSTYSTCDADTPHFYINLKKAKIYPGKKIISGPGNLVLEGIPLPVYLPFGYFPVQTKSAASGILIPKPHYEEGRGYALTEGGYYFAINDYTDLTVKGNMFTNGSWLANTSANYNVIYKFRGSFNLNYANNISGHKGLSDFRQSKNYSIQWTHSQDAKSMPGSTFSASVNMSSSEFDRNNSYNVTDHVTTSRQSSISYSKTWAGTPFNFSASMNQSQNVKNKTVALNLPKMSFGASRIYPFKGRNQQGSTKWYQELQLQYTASFDNQIDTKDSLLFKKEVWNDMRAGFQHEIPVSFQIRPFNNFSISPALNYKGVLFTQKIEKTWLPDSKSVSIDTLNGFFYGQAINPSISAGYSPQIFGMYQFTNPDWRLQKIRHIIKPSVSFSYVPFFSGLSSKMYRQVQMDTLGNRKEYSIYEGNLYQVPALSKRSGSFAFSLINILEAKVLQRNDTTGKPKNVKLIENFNITTSYNIFADEFKWAPVSMVMRTSLFEKLNISAGSNFTLYGTDSTGATIDKFYFTQTNKLMRMNNANLSLDFSLSELLSRNKDKKKEGGNASGANSENNPRYDEYGYAVFDMPWTMNVSYSLNYNKLPQKSQIIQSLSVNGSLSLTKKMSLTYNSGYDFSRKEITMTQIHVTRDLHCWDMSFDWIPNGTMKMWTFTIRVKAAVLADLKYERRKDYHDNY